MVSRLESITNQWKNYGVCSSHSYIFTPVACQEDSLALTPETETNAFSANIAKLRNAFQLEKLTRCAQFVSISARQSHTLTEFEVRMKNSTVSSWGKQATRQMWLLVRKAAVWFGINGDQYKINAAVLQ